MLWQQAEAWSTRPSQILGLTDPLTAFSVDQSVWTFGSELSAALHEATKNIKDDKTGTKTKRAREKVFKKWLTDIKADTAGVHREPVAGPEGRRTANG